MTDYYYDHNPLLCMFGNLNICHSSSVFDFTYILFCRSTVFKYVVELSPILSVNCLKNTCRWTVLSVNCLGTIIRSCSVGSWVYKWLWKCTKYHCTCILIRLKEILFSEKRKRNFLFEIEFCCPTYEASDDNLDVQIYVAPIKFILITTMD